MSFVTFTKPAHEILSEELFAFKLFEKLYGRNSF